MVRFKGTGRFGKALNEHEDRLNRVDPTFGPGTRFTAGPRGVTVHTVRSARGIRATTNSVPRWG